MCDVGGMLGYDMHVTHLASRVTYITHARPITSPECVYSQAGESAGGSVAGYAGQ